MAEDSESGASAVSDEVLEMVKSGSEAGWKYVWENVVLPESRNQRNIDLMRKYGITRGDVMGLLYKEMIGDRKIDRFRNDGGNLWGWMRAFARGYITRANPKAHGELSLDEVREDEDGGTSAMEIPFEDIRIRRNEVWQMTHGCLKSLWNDDPAKAYVLLFKTRHHLSSEEVRQMLDLPSAAAVDQTFSRAVKAMRAAWVRFETKGVMS